MKQEWTEAKEMTARMMEKAVLEGTEDIQRMIQAMKGAAGKEETHKRVLLTMFEKEIDGMKKEIEGGDVDEMAETLKAICDLPLAFNLIFPNTISSFALRFRTLGKI
jgi:hypothetical protein